MLYIDTDGITMDLNSTSVVLKYRIIMMIVGVIRDIVVGIDVIIRKIFLLFIALRKRKMNFCERCFSD